MDNIIIEVEEDKENCDHCKDSSFIFDQFK